MTTARPPGRPIVGRTAEVAALDARLEAVARGSGGVVVITGPAGFGKTRLLEEACARARFRRVRVLTSTAEPRASMAPFAALRTPLTADAADSVFEALALHDAAACDGRSRFAVLQALGERLEEIALRGPVVLALDAMQWADDATRFAVETLPPRLSSHPILWVITSRSHGASDGLAALRRDGALDVRLAPLEPHAVRGLVVALLGGEPDDELLEVAAEADGSPFLLVELLRGLEEEGLVRRDGPLVRLAGRRLPVRLHELVGRQLRGLSDRARASVRMLAAVDRSCTPEDLAALLGVDHAELHATIDELRRAGMLVRRGAAICFRHALVSEAIVAALGPAATRDLRRRAVAVLLERGTAPADLAPLLMDVAEVGDRQAVAVLREAAATLAHTAPSTAADVSRRAVELTATSDPERAAIAAETVGYLYRAGHAREAHALAGTVLRDGRVADAEAEAALRLEIAQLSVQYDFTEAVRQSRLALALTGISGPLRLALQVTETLGHLMNGNAEAAQASMLADLEAARAAGDLAAEVAALNSCSAVMFRADRYAEALALADEAQARAAGAEGAHRLWPEVWGAWVRAALARPDEALVRIAHGLPSAQAAGRAADLGWWLMCRAMALMSAGRLIEARAEAEAAVETGGDLGGGAYLTAADAMLGMIAVHTGEPAALAAAADAAAAMQVDPSLNIRRTGAWVAALLADAAGDPAEAVRLLGDTVDALGTLSPTLDQSRDPRHLMLLVRLLERGGAGALSRQVVAELDRRAALNPDSPLHAFWAAHARAVVERDAIGVQSSVDRAQLLPTPLGRAEVLEDAADVLRTVRSDRSPRLLEEARSLFADVRATRDVRRVEQVLGTRGHSTSGRAPAPASLAGLTPLERSVLQRAASGSTNRRTAAALGLTPQTVAALLRHAYAHLSIASRSELIALLGPENRTPAGCSRRAAVRP